jgi:hypothetical protein
MHYKPGETVISKRWKMKKSLTILCVVLLFCITGVSIAGATPFEISGGSLLVDWDWGSGSVSYIPTSTALELNPGDSASVTYGRLYVPFAAGWGTATFTVNFSRPVPLEPVSDDAAFSVLALWLFSAGSLDFGDPTTFGYSYDGSSGGLMTLAFNDVRGIQLGTWVDITGTIKNTQDPGSLTPVPEPASMLLFGAGLVVWATMGRKKLRRA